MYTMIPALRNEVRFPSTQIKSVNAVMGKLTNSATIAKSKGQNFSPTHPRFVTQVIGLKTRVEQI